MMYIYGKTDPFTYYRDLAICTKGDHTVIIHDQGHNMPRFLGKQLKIFTKFLNKVYEEKHYRPMVFLHAIDKNFKRQFAKQQAYYYSKPMLSKI
mmetsp:Transcript_13656/g.15316  ORF Transcript_13656/g.15316 Transcript_13656/m.15316 type:complete len:94 (+) Transcript_13656:290-571(+)